MCPASLSDLLELFNSHVKKIFNLTGESVKKNGKYVCLLCYCCQSACSDWRVAELTVKKCCIYLGFAVQCEDTLLVSLRTQQTPSIGQRRTQQTDTRLCAHFGCNLINTGAKKHASAIYCVTKFSQYARSVRKGNQQSTQILIASTFIFLYLHVVVMSVTFRKPP